MSFLLFQIRPLVSNPPRGYGICYTEYGSMPIPSDEGILAEGITVEIPRLLPYAYAYLELVRENGST